MLVDELGRKFRLGVYGLAIDDVAVLLTRLSVAALDEGYWTLPGGGLDWGEDPVAGLEREFLEETGLVPQVGEVLGLHSYVGTHNTDLHVIQVVYRVTAGGPLIHELDGTTDQAQWWPLADVGKLPTVEVVNVALGWAGG
ncbi:MAG: NUDIX hydrolase [Acidimicrobiia bacterium]